MKKVKVTKVICILLAIVLTFGLASVYTIAYELQPYDDGWVMFDCSVLVTEPEEELVFHDGMPVLDCSILVFEPLEEQVHEWFFEPAYELQPYDDGWVMFDCSVLVTEPEEELVFHDGMPVFDCSVLVFEPLEEQVHEWFFETAYELDDGRVYTATFATYEYEITRVYHPLFDREAADRGDIIEPDSITLTLSPSTDWLNVPVSGGNRTINVFTNAAFDVSSDGPSWITRTWDPGFDHVLRLTAQPNPSTSPRSGTIIVTANQVVSRSFTVTQLGTGGGTTLNISPSSDWTHISAGGGAQRFITVTTNAPSFNITWSWWLDVQRTATGFWLTAQQNPTTQPRTGFVTVSAGNQSRSFNVSQLAAGGGSNNVTLTFDASGGTPSSVIHRQSGTTIGTMPPNPTRPGFIFEWWHDSQGRPVTEHTVVPNVNSTYWALWTPLATLRFTSDGHTIGHPPPDQLVPVPWLVILPNESGMIRPGHAFVGWRNGSTIFPPHTPFSIQTTGLILFEAVWASTSNMIRVAFNGNGGMSSSPAVYMQLGTQFGILPTAIRANHRHVGWYNTSAATGGTRLHPTTTVTTATTAFWARWVPTATARFTSTGHDNHTSPPAERTVDVPGVVTLPPSGMTRAGYDFGGWRNGSTIFQPNEQFAMNTMGIRMFEAVWTSVSNQVQVAFIGNGGVSSSPTLPKQLNAPFGDLPTAARTNHTFVGWFTTYRPVGGYQIRPSYYVLATRLLLFARWSSRITFNANGGTINAWETTRYRISGVELDTLPVPTRNGYEFIGWFTHATAGDPVDARFIANGHMTLWARWQRVPRIIEPSGTLVNAHQPVYVTWENIPPGATLRLTLTHIGSGNSPINNVVVTGTSHPISNDIWHGQSYRIELTATVGGFTTRAERVFSTRPYSDMIWHSSRIDEFGIERAQTNVGFWPGNVAVYTTTMGVRSQGFTFPDWVTIARLAWGGALGVPITATTNRASANIRAYGGDRGLLEYASNFRPGLSTDMGWMGWALVHPENRTRESTIMIEGIDRHIYRITGLHRIFVPEMATSNIWPPAYTNLGISITIHEMGHALGFFGDSQRIAANNQDVMWPFLHGGVVLQPREIRHLRQIYDRFR